MLAKISPEGFPIPVELFLPATFHTEKVSFTTQKDALIVWGKIRSITNHEGNTQFPKTPVAYTKDAAITVEPEQGKPIQIIYTTGK